MRVTINHRLVDAATIIRIEGNSNYSWIYFAGGRKVLMSTTLLKYQQDLPAFIRVHKSHLINPAFIDRLDYRGPSACGIYLKDNTRIPVSKHRLAGLFGYQKPTLEQVITACRNYTKHGEKTIRHPVRMV